MRSNLETTSPSSLRAGVVVEKEDDDDVTPMDPHGRDARAWAATAAVVVREAARRSMAREEVKVARYMIESIKFDSAV